MNQPQITGFSRLFLRFLRWFCRPELLEDVEGDLVELYEGRATENPVRARLLFVKDVLFLLRPGIVKDFTFINSQYNNTMIKNYLLIAYRNAIRYKGFTAINLLGLAIGIASAMFILLWTQDELSIDRFHAKGDDIYQVWRNMYGTNGDVKTTSYIPKPASDVIKAEYPEIDELVLMSFDVTLDFKLDDRLMKEEGQFVSPGFFEMFSFKMMTGDAKSALENPDAILISEQLAVKYFGNEWQAAGIIGKAMTIDEEGDVIIGGVFESPTAQSTMEFDWLMGIDQWIKLNPWTASWDHGAIRILFTMHDAQDEPVVAERIEQEINDHTEDAIDERLVLRKFQDNYLYNQIENGVVTGGRIDYVQIMLVVAIFLLVIAAINFMNLVTARSNRRAREVGVRKVLGAHRGSIGLQFLTESMLMTTLAVLIALAVVTLLLPYFNILVDKQLTIQFGQPLTWFFLAGLIVTVGFFSGIYPAVLMPAFKAIYALKGVVKHSFRDVFFRKGLVVFQFAISMMLISGTWVIFQQIQYVLNKDLGMEHENLVLVPMEGRENLAGRFSTFKKELLTIPQVVGVTGATGNLVDYGMSTGSAVWEGKDPTANAEIGVVVVNDEFTEVMGMELLKGRSLTADFGADSMNYIVNEVAAELMGFKNPIDKRLSVWGISGRIVGLVKDFHHRDMYEPIGPMIFLYSPNDSRMAMIRIQGNTKEAIAAIEEVSTALNPGVPFRFDMMSDTYKELYEGEKVVSKLANIFSVIAIIISCMGLLALSAFSAEQRSKEIGVRKVHGASVGHIILLLSKDYSKLMLFAILLAVPVTWFYASEWLETFKFHTVLQPWIFILAGLLAFAIGTITVSFKSLQAAVVNPVESLKEE